MYTYRIQLFNDNSQYTAYQGTSKIAAQKAIDCLRAAVLISNGRAEIFAYDNGRTFKVYSVAEGATRIGEILR